MKPGLIVLLPMLLTTNTIAADIDGEFTYEGRIRTYTLHLPPQYNGEDELPLLINLHGYTSTGAGQQSYTLMDAKANNEGFMVVYPDGVANSWNAGNCCGQASIIDIDDVGFISALIDTIGTNYPLDTMRVYATGMSNGGMMSHRLACELADKIAAAGPVAGGLIVPDWDLCQPERLVPIIHFHAVDDGVVPYYGGSSGELYFPSIDSAMQSWAQRNGCDAGPDSFYNKAGALRQIWTRNYGDTVIDTLVVLWTTSDGGHTWPGSINGSDQIVANNEMWEFFTANPMPVEEEPEPGVTEEPGFVLNPANPDIFTRKAIIRFSVVEEQHLTIILYDTSGRKITTLVDGIIDPGKHSVVVDASSLSCGVYFYRLLTPRFSSTRSLILIR